MAITLSDVSKSFGSKTVLSGVSLTLPERGILRICGPSGRGKTTLLRIIAGLLEADSGIVMGTEGTRFSFVFQEDRLLGWYSALRNVALVSDEGRAAQLLDAVGLAESADKLPSQLSGGMRRRVAIARALAYDGDILLLDEPFSGIDEAARRELIAPLITQYAGNKPVILVTHDQTDADILGIDAEYHLQ
ncbi:MAG: ATP-binding cassette domain-containing protein [Ruminococcaceae bacterium]|nr:ATP-binding cassette domain-containing protein [Oscillospiraceae bacterium]